MLKKTSTHITDWQWSREIPFQQDAMRTEAWRCRRSDGSSRAYQVETRIGKPFDVVGLKGGDLDETRAYATFLARSANRLYAAGVTQETVRACPACGAVNRVPDEKLAQGLQPVCGRCKRVLAVAHHPVTITDANLSKKWNVPRCPCCSTCGRHGADHAG